MSGQLDGTSVQAASGLSVSEAAATLNVSERTVRRRIKAGEIVAFQLPTSQGYEWRVQLDGMSEQLPGTPVQVDGAHEEEHPASNPPEAQATAPTESGAGKVDSTAVQLDSRPNPDLQRALELADQFQRQNVELAARVGYLQAKLEAAEQRMLALSAPPEPSPAPWWRRLLGMDPA